MSKGYGRDNFDLLKISNINFKLEFVKLRYKGEKLICEIESDGISTEVEYWKHSIVCYVLGHILHFQYLMDMFKGNGENMELTR